ncbi:MAG TPA: hypothetical protein ENK82_07955 [Campylobacterales bacterium]|nr:hypothetical protein [Campylobacterales bacterium]
MKHIFNDTIVLLNDLENMEMLLKKGIEFSLNHQVPLQVIYVHETPLFQIPDIFLSKEKRLEGSLDKEVVKKGIEERIKALGSTNQYAVFVYENDTLNRLLSLVRGRREVLVITRYQEELLSKLIAKTPFAYCVLKASKGVYEKIALPIDLEDDFHKCIETTQHLFTNGKINLIHDYRFLQENFMVSEDYMGVAATSTQSELEVLESLKEIQKETFYDYLEKYNVQGAFLEGDDVLYEDVINYIKKNHFDVTILYRNEKELLFTSSMIMGLMREIHTDFFVCQK